MSPSKARPVVSTRRWPRFSQLRDVSLSYEGRSQVFSVHLPDISSKGMFINTTSVFPEGSVLKVKFRLALSEQVLDVRCEVRYCLPGVGVGVEFIGMTPKDEKAIKGVLKTAHGKRAGSR